jgi:hypothetical protein
MATTTQAFTWANPVDNDALVPELKAYAAIKPGSMQLLLCHRFSKGAITLLPREVLDMLRDMLMEDELATAREEWGTVAACYREMCRSIDHVSTKHARKEAHQISDFELNCWNWNELVQEPDGKESMNEPMSEYASVTGWESDLSCRFRREEYLPDFVKKDGNSPKWDSSDRCEFWDEDKVSTLSSDHDL